MKYNTVWIEKIGFKQNSLNNQNKELILIHVTLNDMVDNAF